MNMKKKLLALTLASSVLACGGALAFDNKFYLGGELDWNSPRYKDVTTNLNPGGITPKKNRFGVGVFAGLKFHENFAGEVGYNWMRRSKDTTAQGNDYTTTLYNFYADALGFFCVSPEVDLIGALGIGWLKPNFNIDNETITSPDNPNRSKVGLRVGAGAQYKFDENLATRLMFRYQTANSDLIRDNFSAGLGLIWYM